MRKALRLLPLVITIVILLMAIPAIASAAADFKISDLKISPTFTHIDSANINISVRVSNLGDTSGTKKIELFINGVVEDSQDITLDAGTSQQVIFNTVGNEVGEYKVRIGAEEGSFSVAPSNLELTNLLINPPQVEQGDTVVISITAKNTSSDEALSYDALQMLIDGQVVESKPVKLEAGASTTISYSRTADKEGDYIVVIGDKTGSFSIKASFWTAYPPYLWFVFGAVAGVLVMLVVVIAIIPKRRGAAKPGKEKKQSGARGPSQERPQPAPQQGQGRQMPPQQPVQQPPGGRPMPQPPAQAPGGRPAQPPPQVVQGRPPMQSAQPPMPGAMPPGQPPGPQGAFARPAKGAPTPIFSVRNLSVSPTRAREQDEVTITSVISNSGTATGQYSLVLRINSVVEKINELTISPGLSQESSFTIVKETSGEYLVEVDGLRGGFTVVPRIPATFTVSNLSITPERVNQRDTVYISAIVANTGEIKGSYSVVLRIKGIAEGIEEVELEPGANKKVTFEIIKDAAGYYPVSLEHLSGKFVVEMDWNE